MCSTPEGSTKYESTNHHSTNSSIIILSITSFVTQNEGMTIQNSKINIYFVARTISDEEVLTNFLNFMSSNF